MGEKIKALTAFIVESSFCRQGDFQTTARERESGGERESAALCGNGSRLLSLSGGNRWKLANAKDSLPETDVTGAWALVCFKRGKEKEGERLPD